MINAELKDNLGDPLNRTLVPGDFEHSMLLIRMSVRGSIQMPPLVSSELDSAGIELLANWVRSEELRLRLSFGSWQSVYFIPGDRRGGEEADPDGDGQNNNREFLAGTNPLDAEDRLYVSIKNDSGRPTLVALQPANRSLTIEFKDSLDPKEKWQVLPQSGDLPRFPLQKQTLTIPLDENQLSERFFRVRVQSL